MITVSVIKADIGGVPGHSRVHPELEEIARNNLKKEKDLIDFYVTEGFDLSDTTFGKRTYDELTKAKKLLEKALELHPEDPELRGKIAARLKTINDTLNRLY